MGTAQHSAHLQAIVTSFGNFDWVVCLIVVFCSVLSENVNKRPAVS